MYHFIIHFLADSYYVLVKLQEEVVHFNERQSNSIPTPQMAHGVVNSRHTNILHEMNLQKLNEQLLRKKNAGATRPVLDLVYMTGNRVTSILWHVRNSPTCL